MSLSNEAIAVLSRFEAAGFDAYVVGGSLRDTLLGRPAFDIDIASGALPEQTAALFSDMRVIPTGIKHGTVTLITDSGAAFEITTFRTDGDYTDSRHPDSVSFTSKIEDDLSRRDFTVNAMAYNTKRGLVDLFGGKDDLDARIIRCVGEPEKRFSEDALRILRAFRFSAQLDFSIEKETLRAAVKLAPSLSKIARERVSAEMQKLLAAPCPCATLKLLSPLFPAILPEVEADPVRFELCDTLPRDPIARLGLLIFGSGKRLRVASSLRLSTKDSRRLSRLSGELTNTDATSPENARRLLADFGGDLDEAKLFVQIRDAVSQKNPSEKLALLDREAALSPCLSLASLAVSGNDLINNGIAQGRFVGSILSELLNEVIKTPSLNEKSLLLAIAKELSEKL